jgi:hypothetical protein
MDTIYIYGLRCPQSSMIRYIGKTCDRQQRLNNHIAVARLTVCPNHPKDIWIKSLLGQNLRPVMEIIETCDAKNAVTRERFWIYRYSQIACLTNLADKFIPRHQEKVFDEWIQADPSLPIEVLTSEAAEPTGLITLIEASEILGVTLSTVSYYVRTKQLPSVDSDRRTAHRKPRQLVSLADVRRLKAVHDAKDTPPH